MPKPRICTTVVRNNLAAIQEIESQVDFFEMRLDLIGPDWPELIKFIQKPWIACNRSPEEGGQGHSDEVSRVAELLWAAEAGACIADIEYTTKNLAEIVTLIKAKTQCLISFHDMEGTPSYEKLVGIAESQLKAGADICKIVTMAGCFEDNFPVLKLIRKFPEVKMVAFAMGEAGRISRILSPLIGGYFTYASVAQGMEAAAGQIPVKELNELYGWLTNAQ
jgi:3-dehydroquinate dehydratase type I